MSIPLNDIPALEEAAKNGLGTWVIGTFVNALLHGGLFVHSYIYYRFYQDDPLVLKLWVFAVVALSSAAVALMMHVSYFYMVLNFFNPLVFVAGAPISAKLSPVIGPITELLVQMFYVRRVYLVSVKTRYIILLSIPVLLILASTGCSFALAALAFQNHNLDQLVTTVGGHLGTAGAACMFAADVYLTGVLIYSLHTSRTGMKQTDTLIDLLIVYAFSTGFLICIFNLCTIVVSAVLPHSIAFTIIMQFGQEVYCHSFLIALNTRRLLAKYMDRSLSVVESSAKSSQFPEGGTESGSRVAVGDVELAPISFAAGSTATTWSLANSIKTSGIIKSD